MVRALAIAAPWRSHHHNSTQDRPTQRWLSRTSSLFSVRTHRRNWTQRAGGLVEAELPANPMLLLDEWLAAALKDGHIIERGFVLATSSAEEGPDGADRGLPRRLRGRVHHVWYQP